MPHQKSPELLVNILLEIEFPRLCLGEIQTTAEEKVQCPSKNARLLPLPSAQDMHFFPVSARTQVSTVNNTKDSKKSKEEHFSSTTIKNHDLAVDPVTEVNSAEPSHTKAFCPRSILSSFVFTNGKSCNEIFMLLQYFQTKFAQRDVKC